MHYSIMCGNPTIGFSFYGVFTDSCEALEYAENEMRDNEWWLITINPQARQGD